MDKRLPKPVPNGRVDILLFKDQLISYYFSEIETWKTPGMTFDKTLKIIFKDRVVSYPVENIKCWTLYPNGPGFTHEVRAWVREQHDLGHPEENPYQCRHCIESENALFKLREKLTGDK